MQNKTELLTLLRDEYARWEELLTGLSEERLTAPYLPGGLSIKDVVAHLMAWQQRSIARVQAAQQHTQPEFPAWPPDLDPEEDDDLNAINAWIYSTYKDEPWPDVYRRWRDGFRRFIEISETIPEDDLLTPGRFPWMGEYMLADVLYGSHGHHHDEHYPPLTAWLRSQP
jgi:hypothetical protein